ncbi:MAG: glycine zipper family protein [Planctomycetes bacterium]|nr:glycine zipper family protein [Planctomycetota bacterium]
MSTPRTSILLLALSLAACAAPKVLPRQSLAPAVAPPSHAFVDRDRVRVEAAERSTPVPSTPAPSMPEHNAARPGPRPEPPVYRTVVETVEVERVVEVEAPRWRDYGGYDYDVYLDGRRSYRRRGTTPFPVNTAIGAGVGAIIGHQRGRRGRGALIGSGIGLLLDLDRWSRW